MLNVIIVISNLDKKGRTMISSLRNADLEQWECNRRKAKFWVGIIIPLVVPAALGSIFPTLVILWVALGGTVAMSFGGPSLFTGLAFLSTLVVSYLIFSSIVWVAMRYVSKKRGNSI